MLDGSHALHGCKVFFLIQSSSVSTHTCETVCTHFFGHFNIWTGTKPDLQSEPCFEAHRFMAEPELSPRAVQIRMVILLWVVLLYCQCCFLLVCILRAVILTASARLQYVKTIKTSKQSAGDVPECAYRKAFSAPPLAVNRYLLSSVWDNSSGLLHWGYSAVANGLLWQFVCLGVKFQHWIDTF